MKKLKLLAMGIGIMGLSAFGIINFEFTEANANSSTEYCEWNGKDCLSPSVTIAYAKKMILGINKSLNSC